MVGLLNRRDSRIWQGEGNVGGMDQPDSADRDPADRYRRRLRPVQSGNATRRAKEGRNGEGAKGSLPESQPEDRRHVRVGLRIGDPAALRRRSPRPFGASDWARMWCYTFSYTNWFAVAARPGIMKRRDRGGIGSPMTSMAADMRRPCRQPRTLAEKVHSQARVS